MKGAALAGAVRVEPVEKEIDPSLLCKHLTDGVRQGIGVSLEPAVPGRRKVRLGVHQPIWLSSHDGKLTISPANPY